jgi:hypothetical protein
MAMLAEHSIVVLNADAPDTGLNAGDVGTIVYVHDQGKAYEVEFVDGDGTTIALLTLNADEVRPIGSGELLHARRRTLSEQADERKPE